MQRAWLGLDSKALAMSVALAAGFAAQGAQADPVYDCGGVGIILDSNSNAVLNDQGQIGCVTTTYDATARLTGQAEAAAPLGEPITSQYSYDPDSNRIQTVTDPGQTTTTQYDATERLTTTTTQPGDLVTQYTYAPGDPAPLTTTDPNGRITTYDYDGNRLIGTSSTLGAVTESHQYTYDDPMNLLNSATDPLGNVTQYSYDGLDRLSEADTNGNTTSFTYDSVGQLLTMVDSAGTTTFTYNGDGLLASEIDPNSRVTTFTYDGDGRLISDTDGAATPDVNFIFTNDVPEPGSLILFASALGLLAGRRRRRIA